MGGRRLHPLDLRALSTDMDSPDEPTVELSRFKTRALCQSVSIAMRALSEPKHLGFTGGPRVCQPQSQYN